MTLGTIVDERAGEATDTAPHRPRLGRETALVGLVALCTYASTISAIPALTHDSLMYADAIEQGGAALFHPHHLAYNAAARVWLDLAHGLGITGSPLRIIAMFNAVLGACAVSLVWLILRLRAGLPRPLAAAGTAGAGLSFGVWFYSVSVEVYLLALVVLLATFLVLSAPTLSPRRFAVVGALNGAAVLSHQINVLFAVVVLVAAMLRVDRRVAWRRVTAYAGTAAAVVVAGYAMVLAFVVRPGSVAEARGWFTHYADSGGYWDASPAAPARAAVGSSRSIVGGHFAFRLEWVRDQMTSAFPERSLADEAFLVRNLPSTTSWALLVLSGLAMALAAVVVVRGIRRRSELPDGARRLLSLLGVWFVTYTAFFVFWDADNVEFWIPQTTVFWIAAATLWAPTDQRPTERRSRPRGTVALAFAAGTVGLVNLFGTILPATDASNDIYTLRYTAVADLTSQGDLVVVEYPHLGVPYARRLTEADVLSIPSYEASIELEEPVLPSPTDLVDAMDEVLAEGGIVMVDSVLIERPDTSMSRALGAEIDEHYGDRLRPVDVPGADGWLMIDGPSGTAPPD